MSLRNTNTTPVPCAMFAGNLATNAAVALVTVAVPEKVLAIGVVKLTSYDGHPVVCTGAIPVGG